MEEHIRARIAEVNDLSVRVAILETNHAETVRVRDNHDLIISGLMTHDTELKELFLAVSSEVKVWTGKFDVGVKVLLLCITAFGSIIAGLLGLSVYQDARYAPKIETMSSAVTAQATQQQSNVEQIEVQNQRMDNLTEKTGDISDDVKHIKRLKSVAGSK